MRPDSESRRESDPTRGSRCIQPTLGSFPSVRPGKGRGEENKDGSVEGGEIGSVRVPRVSVEKGPSRVSIGGRFRVTRRTKVS